MANVEYRMLNDEGILHEEAGGGLQQNGWTKTAMGMTNVEYRMLNDEGILREENGFVVREPQRVYDLEDRLISFAVQVCRIAEKLPATRVGHHVAGQLIRSGTSPASNYGEAQSADSRRDFLHKMRICLKELRETHVWLRFVRRLNLDRSETLEQATAEANELISIFVRSIQTARKGTNP